jgi:uncharacterized protein with FMN-binding domain
MRRAVPVIAATAGALTLLANFHTSPGGAAVTTKRPAAGGATPATNGSAVAGAGTTAPPVTAGPASPGATATTDDGGTPHTVDGPVVSTRYGDVQVRVTLQGNKVVDVQALQLPSDRSRSQRISQEAGPLLRSEVLQAQSPNIDIVSGATYTSEGYAQSLQGALDGASG